MDIKEKFPFNTPGTENWIIFRGGWHLACRPGYKLLGAENGIRVSPGRQPLSGLQNRITDALPYAFMKMAGDGVDRRFDPCNRSTDQPASADKTGD